jgi:Glycosyl hydrolase family 92 N-terminal domain
VNAFTDINCNINLSLVASRVAHLRFTFDSTLSPYILFEVARPSLLTLTANISFPVRSVSIPTNISFPVGTVSITSPLEVCGSSSERQDSIITPISIAPFAEHFKGYFCARFDQDTPQASYGVIQNGTVSFPSPQNTTTEGPLLSAFAKFPAPLSGTCQQTIITLRVGTSFISEDQARSNIDAEIPTSTLSVFSSNDEFAEPHLIPGTFENTAYRVRKSWTDLLDRIELEPWVDANSSDPLEIVDLQIFWTAIVHTLQVHKILSIPFLLVTDLDIRKYPYEQHEQNRYYSGYDNTVHQFEQGGESYNGYSTWVSTLGFCMFDLIRFRILSVLNGLGKSFLYQNGSQGWYKVCWQISNR